MFYLFSVISYLDELLTDIIHAEIDSFKGASLGKTHNFGIFLIYLVFLKCTLRLVFIIITVYTVWDHTMKMLSKLWLQFQRKKKNKSHNLTYCFSIQPVVVYDISEYLSGAIIRYATGAWQFCSMISVYLMRCRFASFFF